MGKYFAVAIACAIGSYVAAWYHMPLTLFGTYLVGGGAVVRAARQMATL